MEAAVKDAVREREKSRDGKEKPEGEKEEKV